MLLFGREAIAQKPFQLYVTSYNDTVDIVYFCHGIAQNQIGVNFGLANLFYQSDPNFHVDSIIFICDTNVFKSVGKEMGFDLPQVFFGSGPEYVPPKPGSDTLKIRGYYGNYFSEGTIIFHAVNSPPIGMYGYMNTSINLGNNISFGGDQLLIVTDTLHDKLNGGLGYVVSTTPQPTGFNKQVELRACGDVTIDSINQVGDFTEFNFYNMPTLPFVMHIGDKLQLPYFLIPRVVGRFPHYLVFHTAGGKYLVWSFEYKVAASKGVAKENPSENKAEILPNPASAIVNIIWKGNPQNIPKSYQIIDNLGRIIQGGTLSFSAESHEAKHAILHTENLSNGPYKVILFSGKDVSTIKLLILR